jgi:hypothetical protein
MRPGRGAEAWFRQPVVWLAAAVLVVTIAACVATIVLAHRHADVPVDTGERNVMTIPLRSPAAAPPAAQAGR